MLANGLSYRMLENTVIIIVVVVITGCTMNCFLLSIKMTVAELVSYLLTYLEVELLHRRVTD